MRLIDIRLIKIFGLKENHLPVKEERVAKEEESISKLPMAINLPNVSLDIKEAKRIGRYRQDIETTTKDYFCYGEM